MSQAKPLADILNEMFTPLVSVAILSKARGGSACLNSSLGEDGLPAAEWLSRSLRGLSGSALMFEG